VSLFFFWPASQAEKKKRKVITPIEKLSFFLLAKIEALFFARQNRSAFLFFSLAKERIFFFLLFAKSSWGQPRKKKGNRGGCFAGEKLVFIINNYIYIYYLL